jgi:signal transduction histidine kinase
MIFCDSSTVMMPKRFRAAHRSHVHQFAETGVTNRRMGAGPLLRGLRANGEEFPLDASISQVETPEGRLFTVILRDMTERMRAQEELAAFAAEATGAREQEKSRIARELHDELAQTLAAVKMDARWTQENLDRKELASAKLETMIGLIDQAVASTRRIAGDLRPLVLDDLGLIPALEWLAGAFTDRHGIPCALDVDPDMDLQEPYATALFRMVQESLVNVAKHAHATAVQVRLASTPHGVEMTVSDNGVGFDPGEAPQPSSLGLIGLRERAKLLRGTVAVTSERGRGTRVHARIPLERVP